MLRLLSRLRALRGWSIAPKPEEIYCALTLAEPRSESWRAACALAAQPPSSW